LLVLHCLCDGIDFQLFGAKDEGPDAAGACRRGERGAAAGLRAGIDRRRAGAAYSTLEDRRSSGTQLDDDAIELRAGSRIRRSLRDKVHVNVAAFNAPR